MPRHTLLGRWMKKHGVTERALAKRLGTSCSLVHRWAVFGANGMPQRMPDTRMAFAIGDVTHNEVPPRYWARLAERRVRQIAPDPQLA